MAPDAVWDGRSGGSRNEGGSGVRGSVNEKGNFVGDCVANSGDFAAIMEDMNKLQRPNSDGN